MNKVLSSMIAIGFAGASFAVFAQPAVSETTTVERSSTVEVPKPDVRVDERKTTTTVTRPDVNAESKSTTTTTKSKRKAQGDTTVEVRSKTKTETENKYENTRGPGRGIGLLTIPPAWVRSSTASRGTPDFVSGSACASITTRRERWQNANASIRREEYSGVIHRLESQAAPACHACQRIVGNARDKTRFLHQQTVDIAQ